MAQVIVAQPEFFPQKIKVFGPGVEPNGVEMGKKTSFTIDHKDAGTAPLEVKVNDSKGNSIPVQIVEKGEGIKNVTYAPASSKPHTVEVNFGGVAVPNSPFRVYVSAPLDPSKVRFIHVRIYQQNANNHRNLRFSHSDLGWRALTSSRCRQVTSSSMPGE